MRRLVLALVLANVLMFGWNRGWFDRAGDLRSSEENADRLRPVPLSRLEPARQEPRRPAPAASTPRVAAPPAAAPGVSPTVAPNVPPAAPPGTPPAAPPSAPPSAPPTPPPETSSTRAAGGLAVACRAFAPVDEERAAALRSALEQSGASVEAQRIEQGASYLVYLPPAANAVEAQQRLAELRRIGRDDAFVIQDGPMRLAISLGLFRFENAARAMVDQLARAGETRALVAPRPPIQVRIALQARWSQVDAGAIATMLGAQFDAPARDCD